MGGTNIKASGQRGCIRKNLNEMPPVKLPDTALIPKHRLLELKIDSGPNYFKRLKQLKLTVFAVIAAVSVGIVAFAIVLYQQYALRNNPSMVRRLLFMPSTQVPEQIHFLM